MDSKVLMTIRAVVAVVARPPLRAVGVAEAVGMASQENQVASPLVAVALQAADVTQTGTRLVPQRMVLRIYWGQVAEAAVAARWVRWFLILRFLETVAEEAGAGAEGKAEAAA